MPFTKIRVSAPAPYKNPTVTHSEGHPDTQGTFTGTLVNVGDLRRNLNVGDLRRNFGECQGGTREYTVVGSPMFARLRQSSHEGARMLPVHPLSLPDRMSNNHFPTENCVVLRKHAFSQQFAYGVVREGSLQKNFREIYANFPQNSARFPGAIKCISLQISANVPQNFRKFSAKTPSLTTPQVNC